MQFLDYVAIVGYLAVTMVIVYRSSRKQDDTEDFFLGGRRMPWLAVGLSIMATLLSTNTYLGLPGEIIKYGPAYMFGYLAYPLVAVVVLCLWIPFFMRLRLTSAYEYLERRFDYRARFVGGLLFLGMRLGWMSMVVYTASKAMVAMVGSPLVAVGDWFNAAHPVFPVIALVGIAATVYACLGGMRAVIWTDVLQAVMLFGGVALIIGYVAGYDSTGVGTWWSTITASSDRPAEIKWAAWDITERTTIFWAIFQTLAWHSCTHCSDQVALQRYFTTDSVSAARNSFLVNIISASSIGVLLGIAGIALRYFYLTYPQLLSNELTADRGADDLMPFFYANQLPAGFAGLILVSFLCDAMQTLVSGVNSISAIITKDVTDHRGPSARLNELWLARAVTVFVGVASTGLALAAGKFALNAGHTIFDMLPRMFLMFLGPMGSMFMVGMFFRRATPRVILATVLVTQTFSFLWSWWAEIPALAGQIGLASLAEYWPSILGYDGEVLRKPSVMLAVGAPCLFGIVLGGLLSLLFGNSNHLGTAYTWRAVLSRPSENVE